MIAHGVDGRTIVAAQRAARDRCRELMPDARLYAHLDEEMGSVLFSDEPTRKPLVLLNFRMEGKSGLDYEIKPLL